MGNFVWVKTIGGIANDRGTHVVVDNQGNAYATGSFPSAVDFDPNIGVYLNFSFADVEDLYVWKLDMAGNFVWVKTFGSSGFDYGNSIDLDVDNNVYFTGRFEGTVDFDPGLGTYNLSANGSSDDIFIAKIDDQSNFLYAGSMGGAQDDEAYSIFVDDAGSFDTTDRFRLGFDFDPGLASFFMAS